MTLAADLRSQLESLRTARASGVRSIEFRSGNGSSRRVEYKDDAQMAAAIADLERQIAAIEGRRVSTIHLRTSKGI
jgi:transposase